MSFKPIQPINLPDLTKDWRGKRLEDCFKELVEVTVAKMNEIIDDYNANVRTGQRDK